MILLDIFFGSILLNSVCILLNYISDVIKASYNNISKNNIFIETFPKKWYFFNYGN